MFWYLNGTCKILPLLLIGTCVQDSFKVGKVVESHLGKIFLGNRQESRIKNSTNFNCGMVLLRKICFYFGASQSPLGRYSVNLSIK